MPIGDSNVSQAFCQRLGIELRVMSGAGDGADIDEKLDSVRLQDSGKLVDPSGGMADGPEYER